MAAPIVYRWDDGNAPVARGERRSLCDILYACLVTGYGTKPAAGWTRPYINGTYDKAAFRNNPATGTGFYLQVDGAGAAAAWTPIVQGFEVMTSESAGLFPFNATVQTQNISNAANTTARPWILIADDRAFIFYCWPTITGTPGNADSSANSVLYFGDIIKFKSGDAYGCGLSTGATTSTSLGYLQGPSLAIISYSQGVCFPRKADGSAGSYVSPIVRGGGPGAEARAGDTGLAYTAGDQILVSRPHLNEGVAYTLRGWLPGFYYPCHPMAFDQLATVSGDGKSFLSLRVKIVNGTGNVFIDLGDWRL